MTLAELENEKAQSLAEIAAASDAAAVEALRVKYVGRNGSIPALIKAMKDVPKEERPAFGKAVQAWRAEVEAALAAKAVARRLGVKCGVVLYPRGYHLSSFDCILAPSFDNPAKRPNVVEIPANLVANDAEFYEKGVAAFKERYAGATDNLVGVIVGGPNKCSTMTVEWTKARLDEIFAANAGAQLCVTTSRRTPADVEAVVDSYPWAYKLIYSKDHFNPIPAFVQLAKRLYVTAESTGMLSEACTFGTAEVVALDNLNPGPHKFRRFVENLSREGYVDGRRKVDLSVQFACARALMGL